MSKKDELLKAIKKLKDLNIRELEFLKGDNLDEKSMEDFMEKKIKLRKLLDHHLKTMNFDKNEKVVIKELLEEVFLLEESIGKTYKEKLLNIEEGLLHINTERKLRETYGRGGMSFLSEEEKNLK